MTLTGLSRAGADPELHHYKEKYKNEGPSESIGSPNNRLILSAQKLKTFTFGKREQNKGTTKPQR